MDEDEGIDVDTELDVEVADRTLTRMHRTQSSTIAPSTTEDSTA